MILLEKTRKNDDIPDDYIADDMKYPQIWDAILLIHKLNRHFSRIHAQTLGVQIDNVELKESSRRS